MNQGLRTVVVPVRDLAQAKALYQALLGAEPHTDQPSYVGFRLGDQDIALDPNGHAKGMSGTIAYWHVDDLHERLQQLLAAGAQIDRDVQDVGGGRLIVSVKDADGNVVGLLQDPR
jgi:predicted enzyme related to lactoylglutathione lyase